MTRLLGRDFLALRPAPAFAFAAFNVSNLETTQAVLAAAEEARAPVILQLSPGAIAYAGYGTLMRLVFHAAEQAAVPVLVHLDHCRERDLVIRAIDDGFGSVMFDGSRLPFEDNVRTTLEIVGRARRAGVAVEAELGVIGGIEDTTPERANDERTTPEEARRFVEATDVDLLAPALGSVHRMPDDAVSLDIAHLARVAAAAGRPLALHGGSGVARQDLGAAIEAGVGKVNISSRVSRALAAGIRATWEESPGELDLRRYLGAGREAVRRLAIEYFGLTRSAGLVGLGHAPAGLAGGLEEPE